MQIRHVTDPWRDAYFRTFLDGILRVIRAVLIAKGETQNRWNLYDWDTLTAMFLTDAGLAESIQAQPAEFISRVRSAREDAQQLQPHDYDPTSRVNHVYMCEHVETGVKYEKCMVCCRWIDGQHENSKDHLRTWRASLLEVW